MFWLSLVLSSDVLTWPVHFFCLSDHFRIFSPAESSSSLPSLLHSLHLLFHLSGPLDPSYFPYALPFLAYRFAAVSLTLAPTKYCTYRLYPWVPQCLSHRPNWDPPNTPYCKRECPPEPKGGGHTRLRVRGWGSQFGRLKKKTSTLCTLCWRPMKWMRLKFCYLPAENHFSK